MGLQLCYSQWAVNQIKKSTCTNSLFSVLLSWEPLLPLMPRLMLMPTTATTPPCTMPTPTGPESQLPSHPPPVSAAVARGPLMLRLMPMPTMAMDTTPTTVPSTTPVLPDTPEPLPLSSPDLPRDLARGLLMPKPMLMLTTATTDTVTVMVIMVDTEVTTDIPMDTDTTIKWRELFC